MKTTCFETGFSDPDNIAKYCAIIAIAAPLVSWAGLFLLLPLGNESLLWGAYILYVAHATLTILFGLAVFYCGIVPENPAMSKVLAGLGGLSALFLLAFISTMALVAERAKEYKQRSCSGNLTQLGMVTKMYANESDQSQLPRLSARSGELSMEMSEIYPKYLGYLDTLKCPRIDDGWLEHEYDMEHFHVLSDQSYFYLGYLIDSPVTLRAFQEAYTRTVAEGGNFEKDLPVPPGKGTWGGEVILRLSDLPLSEFLQAAPSTPSGEDALLFQSKIPIMIERPEYHPRSATTATVTVLYLDGHVEHLTYPGEWPADEETMATLYAMDALGPRVPAGTFKPRKAPPVPLYFLAGLALGAVLFGAWTRAHYRGTWVLSAYAAIALLIGFFVYLSPQPDLSKLPVAAPDGTITQHRVAVTSKRGSQSPYAPLSVFDPEILRELQF